MTKTIQKALWAFLALVFLFISLNGIFGGAAFGAPANAASPVLADLQRDENFNIDDYPEKLDDYGLNVIQIAESSDSELFIYVYQPSGQGTGIFASSINIATVPNSQLEAQSFKTYNLIKLNSESVFFKYKVQNFELKNDQLRYYNISNILRPYIEKIDGKNENDNHTSEVDCAVGQLWTAYTTNSGDVDYFNTVSDVIEITDKYVGFLRYYDAYGVLGNYFTDAHFVAFSTDRSIDRLYEIDIEFVKQSRQKVYGGFANSSFDDDITLGTPEKQAITIYGDEVDHNSGDWFGHNKYTWDKIRTTSEFLKSENNSYYRITQSGSKNLENTEWTVNFFTSSVTVVSTTGSPITNISDVDTDAAMGQRVNSTYVSDVIILRLKFEADGIRYNLGVIDNKQTGSDAPINKIKQQKKSLLDIICEWLEKMTGIPALVWKIIICALPFAVIMAVLSIIFPGFRQVIGQIVLWIFKAILLIICLPFLGIAALIRKRKKASPSKSSKAKMSKSSKSKSRTSSRRSSARTGRKSYVGSKSK